MLGLRLAGFPGEAVMAPSTPFAAELKTISDLDGVSAGAMGTADGAAASTWADISVDRNDLDAVSFAHKENSVIGTDRADDVSFKGGSGWGEGMGGDDRLVGSEYNDHLDGGAGDDTLTGGKGDDVLIGGSDSDNFVFGAGDGHDTIRDFDPTDGDRIVLEDTFGFDDLSIEQEEGGTLVRYGDGDSIYLEGVDAQSLTAESFEFADPLEDLITIDEIDDLSSLFAG